MRKFALRPFGASGRPALCGHSAILDSTRGSAVLGRVPRNRDWLVDGAEGYPYPGEKESAQAPSTLDDARVASNRRPARIGRQQSRWMREPRRSRLTHRGCSPSTAPPGRSSSSSRGSGPRRASENLDINARAVRAAQLLLRASGAPDRVTVACVADAAGEQHGSYDAVFTMAAFRHGRLSDDPRTSASPTARRQPAFRRFPPSTPPGVSSLPRTTAVTGSLPSNHAMMRIHVRVAESVVK